MQTEKKPQIEFEQPNEGNGNVQGLNPVELIEVSNEDYREIEVHKGIVKLSKYEDKTPITQSSLDELKMKCEAIVINGVDDKENYKLAKELKSKVTKARTNLENVRKELVADSVYFQKKINEKAKELTAQISEIENPLAEKIKEIDDLKEAEKKRLEMEAERKANERINSLIEQGMMFTGEYYEIGSVSISVVDVRTISDESFNILFEKVKEVSTQISLEKKQKEELERKEKLKSDRVLTLLKNGFTINDGVFTAAGFDVCSENELGDVEQSDFDNLLENGIAFINEKKDNEEKERLELERAQKELELEKKRIQDEKLNLIKQKTNSRISRLAEIGFVYDVVHDLYFFKHEKISFTEMQNISDENFEIKFSQLSESVAEIKKKLEEERIALAESERAAQIEREQKEQAEKEEAARIEAEKAPDVEKINTYFKQVSDFVSQIPTLKSIDLKNKFESDINLLKAAITELQKTYEN